MVDTTGRILKDGGIRVGSTVTPTEGGYGSGVGAGVLPTESDLRDGGV